LKSVEFSFDTAKLINYKYNIIIVYCFQAIYADRPAGLTQKRGTLLFRRRGGGGYGQFTVESYIGVLEVYGATSVDDVIDSAL